jgi:L-asparaginase II
MSEVLIHKTRGRVVECIHRGDVVVLGQAGQIVASNGDPHKYTFMRSSAKPIQALNVLLSGAAGHYRISPQELAIMCASHYAEPMHLDTVRSILAKAGLSEALMQSGKALSIKPEIAFQQAAEGIKPDPIHSDCSGKHSGMLITCKHLGLPLENYLDPEHPVQKQIFSIFSEVCAYPGEEIGVGMDGCNVPVFALPIYHMALAYLRMANPELLPEKYQAAATRVFEAMNTHPEMVGGTGSFCTALMRTTKGRMIGKVGAQGGYCIGVKEPKLGIALKIEDGGVGMAQMAAMQVLSNLKLLTESEYEALRSFHHQPNLNDDKHVVGQIRPVFSLDLK